ncbi:MAG: hypothetical protein KC419_00595 [Anaerolineales bacterium]|nr:hypothetical protein [Anaerolineales bacterium]
MTRQLSSRHHLLILITILIMVLLPAACADEPELLPTPIMPPPNLDDTDGSSAGEETADNPAEAVEAETAVSPTPSPDANITATPTLVPTPTLLPTATPVTDPALSPMSTAPLPAVSHDLVFLSDGALQMWNHNNGRLETLYAGSADADAARETPFTQHVGDIIRFDVSADGNRIVAVRLTHSETLTPTVTGDEPPVGIHYTEYELLFLDVVSKESWTLIPTVTDLRDVAISPNQQQVAFIGSSLTHQEAPNADALPENAQVYVIGTPDGTVRTIGPCTEFCGGITWHPSSDFFTWTDSEALWLFNLSGSEPHTLLANQTSDPASTQVFQGISWAQNGRLFLLWQQAWEGGSRVVLDVPTGQVIPVPDSFVYADPFPTEVSWMQDDRLLIARSTIGSSRSAALELWRVNVEEGRLVLEESTQPDGPFSIAGGVHLQDGRFAYALLNQDDPQGSGLYLQISLTELPERANGLIPAFIAPDVFWSPDGSGAVVVQNGYVLYAPANGEGLWDGTAVFGSRARDFVWLPPGNAPR